MWLNRLERALSIRLAFFCLVLGICVYVLVRMAWSGVGYWLMWLVAAVAWAAAVWFNTGQMVKCDACHKRVKMGADVCHHCGYARA